MCVSHHGALVAQHITVLVCSHLSGTMRYPTTRKLSRSVTKEELRRWQLRCEKNVNGRELSKKIGRKCFAWLPKFKRGGGPSLTCVSKGVSLRSEQSFEMSTRQIFRSELVFFGRLATQTHSCCPQLSKDPKYRVKRLFGFGKKLKASGHEAPTLLGLLTKNTLAEKAKEKLGQLNVRAASILSMSTCFTHVSVSYAGGVQRR